MGSIRENLDRVRRAIESAARRSGRAPEGVRLVAVGKSHPAERLVEAIEAGVEILGENRVQEARRKRAEMGESVAGRVTWHLVGSLQKNKARHVPGVFDAVESVDSLALARELARRLEEAGRDALDVLVQVNTGAELQKGGVMPEEALDLLKEVARLRPLHLIGLMCIPPFSENPEEGRQHFRILRGLRDEAQRAGLEAVRELSMGMSADFEVAVEEGATFVRVGTAIFGFRPEAGHAPREEKEGFELGREIR